MGLNRNFYIIKLNYIIKLISLQIFTIYELIVLIINFFYIK